MRGDVKERFSLRPLREEMDVANGIQPDLRYGEALCSRRGSHRPRQSTVSARRFHNSMVRRLRSGSYASKPGLALIRQPWSYLRLEAYSFFGLCEGAYGDFGGSVLNNSTGGLTHRLILSLDPERRKNRLASHRVSKPGPAWLL